MTLRRSRGLTRRAPLPRGAGLTRGKKLARGKGLSRGKAMPRINAARKAKEREADFGSPEQVAAISRMPCVCGGKHSACTGGWSEPSHVVSRGAGGKLEHIVPMSSGCHRAWHQHGRKTYLAKLGMTLDQILAAAATTSVMASADGGMPA